MMDWAKVRKRLKTATESIGAELQREGINVTLCAVFFDDTGRSVFTNGEDLQRLIKVLRMTVDGIERDNVIPEGTTLN